MARQRVRRTKQSLRSLSRQGQSYPVMALYDADLVAERRGSSSWSKVMAAGLMLLNVWFLYAMFANQRFQVKEIHISETRCVSEEQVRRLLPAVEGSILRVKTDEIEKKLESSLGCIEQAQVTCRLPDQIDVALKSYAELLVWQTGDAAWWVDMSGRVLGRAELIEDEIVIEDTTGISTTMGCTITDVPWQLAYAMTTAMPSAHRYLYMADRGLVIRITNKGWPVYLGRDGQAQAKAAVLQGLAARLIDQGAEVEHIDLRNERQPTYRTR